MRMQSTKEEQGYSVLRIEADQVSLVPSITTDSTPSVTSLATVKSLLRPNHLTGETVEKAINEVEDLIIPMIRNLPDNTELKLAGSEWEHVFQLLSVANGATVPIESVENLYTQLADYALGSPTAWRHGPSPEQVAPSLVVLREVMHHAGFRTVSLL